MPVSQFGRDSDLSSFSFSSPENAWTPAGLINNFSGSARVNSFSGHAILQR